MRAAQRVGWGRTGPREARSLRADPDTHGPVQAHSPSPPCQIKGSLRIEWGRTGLFRAHQQDSNHIIDRSQGAWEPVSRVWGPLG
jgi:hypothetical protein